MPSHSAARRVAVWVPVLLSLVVQLVTTAAAAGGRGGPWHADGAAARPGVVVLGALVAIAGPALLVVIRRSPGPLLVAVAAVAVAGEALFASRPFAPLYLSVLFAVVVAVLRGARVWAWSTVGALWLGAVLWAVLAPAAFPLALLVPGTVLAIASLAIPEAARSRRRRFAELRRREQARRDAAAEAERMRIAREVHDVLAHSLSVINVQASVGLHLFEQQPQKAADALANIKESSRTALAEVRQVLGVLRGDADQAAPLVPEPDLSRLPALAASTREQGVETTLSDALTTIPPAATQSAIYRIVQEAMTNVLKHSGAASALIELDEDPEQYRVRVTDDGSGGVPAAGSGRGLLGMRERAELLGGSFSAGPVDHGFEVVARFPKGDAA